MPEALTRPQIRDRLTAFVARWSQRRGDEKSEAQTFLGELLDCYDPAWRSNQDIRFEHHYDQGGYADLLWKGSVVVEMKTKHQTEKLVEQHWSQAFDYWDQSAFPDDGIAAPQYLVLCSFDRFVIWEPGDFPVPVDQRPGDPRVDFRLAELPERVEVLDFLRGSQANFAVSSVDLAEKAVDAVTGLYLSLVERGIAADRARDFTLQVTWCCFAEDLDMFPELLLTHAAERLKSDPSLSSYDMLGELFEWLNRDGERPTGGAFKGAPYVNGGLFERPAHVELERAEVELLFTACHADWSNVEPSVFGGLFTGTLALERRRVSGAHYTPEAEIQKIVQPTIVDPWRERIQGVTDGDDALALLEDLAGFRVLDPACGSGNFLYVAYQELRTLEQELRGRAHELLREAGRSLPQDLPTVSLSNALGIEKDPFAARLAQVVLWIGHKLAVDKHGLSEDVLPLADLSGVVCADALHIDWPECDAIIGNPPFVGSQNLRAAVGDEEIEWIKETFGVGVKDYCIYWFRRAHDHLRPDQHAGLVGTNSVAQNRARSESLDYIAEHGGIITNAVSTQPWPGEANVHVSLVNWVKDPTEPPATRVLDGANVTEISPSLKPAAVGEISVLEANRGRSFQGPIPGDEGFVLADGGALELLKRLEADYKRVVRRYLVGRDIARQPGARPSRWVIDFGSSALENAETFPAAMSIVRERVKPRREKNRRKVRRENWWRFSELALGMRRAISVLDRYIAGTATGKRLLFCWVDADVCPSNAVNVFAFNDDYSMGVLLSAVHGQWAWAQSSTLKGDLRYTPTSVFATFPWPTASDGTRAEIGALAGELIDMRNQLSIDREIGLTTLYNECDEGAHGKLRALHDSLDRAVAGAYGWPVSILADPTAMAARLADLNMQIAAGEREYEPFAPLPSPDTPQEERLFVPDGELF